MFVNIVRPALNPDAVADLQSSRDAFSSRLNAPPYTTEQPRGFKVEFLRSEMDGRDYVDVFRVKNLSRVTTDAWKRVSDRFETERNDYDGIDVSVPLKYYERRICGFRVDSACAKTTLCHLATAFVAASAAYVLW